METSLRRFVFIIRPNGSESLLEMNITSKHLYSLDRAP